MEWRRVTPQPRRVTALRAASTCFDVMAKSAVAVGLLVAFVLSRPALGVILAASAAAPTQAVAWGLRRHAARVELESTLAQAIAAKNAAPDPVSGALLAADVMGPLVTSTEARQGDAARWRAHFLEAAAEHGRAAGEDEEQFHLRRHAASWLKEWASDQPQQVGLQRRQPLAAAFREERAVASSHPSLGR